MYDVEIYKKSLDAIVPVPSTLHSACFDLRACLHTDTVKSDGNFTTNVIRNGSDNHKAVVIKPNERLLIPTGLIFMLPMDKKMLIYSRSGMCWKEGLAVLNAPGVVDAGYGEEVYVMLHNTSEMPRYIVDGDRIAQGEIVPRYMNHSFVVNSSYSDVEKYINSSNRKGGFGSTGTK